MTKDSESVYQRTLQLSALQKNIEQLIENKIFLGQYVEKRYVESLQTYRDIIIIESTEDIVKSLWEIKKALTLYGKDKWIGITNDPQNSDSDDCLLWVIVNKVPIGKHWFQIHAIDFQAKEIMLELKYLQPFRSFNTSFNGVTYEFPTFKTVFTYSNLCQTIKFSAVTFMALFTFVVGTLKYIAEYTIELGYLILNFVHVSVPIWHGLFEFLAKCVSGLYFLIYLLTKQPANVAMPKMLNNKRPIDCSTSTQLCLTSGSDNNQPYNMYKKRN